MFWIHIYTILDLELFIGQETTWVTGKSFEEVIPNFPNDLIYLDPPYYMEKKDGDDDNKMFKAIYPNSNFPLHHMHFDHEKLRDLLHSHNGPFILSYNDCDWVRENYKDFKFKLPKWHYSNLQRM